MFDVIIKKNKKREKGEMDDKVKRKKCSNSFM